MGITHRSRLYLLLVLSLMLGACESTTAPSGKPGFDSGAALEAYAEMDSLLTTPVLASFDALAGRTPFSSMAAAEVVGALADAGSPDGGRAFALALGSRLQAASLAPGGAAAAPVISDLRRGVTFAYDPDTDAYAPDPERTDAPATGVRFVLYEIDLLGRPIVEQEIGYADLVDEGDASAEDIALRLSVVVGGTTVLEYRTTLDVQATSGTLGVHGVLQDQIGRKLDFDIDATGTRVGDATTLDVAFELRVDARDFSIVGTVSGIREGGEGEGDIELVVRHGDDSIRLDVEGDGGEIDGSVFVNGALFATVTGDARAPVIASATGDPLTLRESLALRHVMDGVEDVFDFLEDLLDPVDELVVLAIIL